MFFILGIFFVKLNFIFVGFFFFKFFLLGLSESVGMIRNGDFGVMKRFVGLFRDFMYFCGVVGDNGIE